MSTLHVVPSYPAAHAHVKLPCPSVQVPPFKHGSLAHSLTVVVVTVVTVLSVVKVVSVVGVVKLVRVVTLV